MKRITTIRLIPLFMLVLWIVGCSNQGQQQVQEEPETTEEVAEEAPVRQVSSDLTSDFPKEGPSESSQKAFEAFGWEMFVALNWPASGTKRGEPDPTKVIGDEGAVVWLTYKTSSETFLSGGQDPGPWDAGYDETRKLTETSKVPEELVQYLKSINQAVGGPLTDQNKNLVYYEKLLNQAEYDYIQSNQYYDNSVLSGLTKNLTLPNYSIEIKAAWKILESMDRKERFYTIEALVGEQAEPKTVGLVGLHITYKTPNSPQWIWSTFEQIDNTGGENGTAGPPYSFYNPDCSTADCPPNVETKPGDPTQLTRFTQITQLTDSINQSWQNKLKGSPWEYYQLISTQWPTDPHNFGNPLGSPAPTVLANLTMESYIQPTSSCTHCHSTARTTGGVNVKTDFSFLFLEAKSSN